MGKGNKISLLSLCMLSFAVQPLFPALETRNKLLFYFDKIEVKGDLDVFIKKGQKRGKVSIYADSEIMDSVTAKVRQKTLFLDANNSYEFKRRIPFVKLNATRKFPVEIMVYVEEIAELRILESSNLSCYNISSSHLKVFHSSTGDVHLESVNTPKIEVLHLGSGRLSLQGEQTTDLELEVRGNGIVDAGELEVSTAKVVHHGKGELQINPEQWLDARLLSSGSIFLHQNPTNSVVKLKGTGQIKNLFEPAENAGNTTE
jgi:hypothetical protein